MPLIRDVPAAQLSPYLRQHTANPVDWYTWGEDAFERAAGLDRPIFLSIGYSACHWCHVMAHESFEDPASAAALNASFVSIKVDREERPDVDAVYMEAVQAITGSGGWPMSMFLTPDRRPFFGGTYFPPADRPGLPGFRTVLDALTDVWDNRRSEVEEQADQLCRAIGSRSEIQRPEGAGSLFASAGLPADAPDLSATALEELADRFDPQWGGFGGAPKFPQPALVDLALSHSLRGEADPTAAHARHMAVTTLDAMAAGGIHDHLGGGFARYSTDAEWLVPHFEKMLYDQAGLLRAFLHGWQVTGSQDYLDVVAGIITYVSRDLTSHEGGVYSAEDADSEGVEGRFYVWSPDQMATAVSEGVDRPDGGQRGDGRSADRLVRRDARGELRGQQHPAPTGGRRPPRGCPRRVGPADPVGVPRHPGQARARRQDPHRVERHVRFRGGRGGGRHRRPGLGRRRGGHRAVPLRPPGRAPTAAGCGAGSPPAGRVTWPTPVTTPG